ncbi:MAG TPA: hypothetical protein VIU37_09170 [Candidatus Limnocylindrales bacterium]
MPMWRCPHCATPQAETARCWVCHRSSTACGSCRHFRRSVAAQLGYCGLDRQRRPLTGEEIRECWESLDAQGSPATPVRPTVGPAAGWALEPGEDRTPVRLRDFVEVRIEPARSAGLTHASPAAGDDPAGPVAESPRGPAVLSSPAEPRWSLWGDAEA